MKKVEPPLLLEALKEYDRRNIELLESKVLETEIEFPEDFDEKMNRLIDAYKRSNRFTRFYNTTAKRVACFIIIFFVVALTTIMSVDAFREPIINYITHDLIADTSVEVVSDDNADVPTNIKEYKKPSYIPDGYEIVSIEKDTTFQMIIYEKPNTKCKIMYDQSLISGTISYFNTEDSALQDITVGDYDGKRLSRPEVDTETIYWSDGKYGYEITAFYLDTKELIKIGESIR